MRDEAKTAEVPDELDDTRFEREAAKRRGQPAKPEGAGEGPYEPGKGEDEQGGAPGGEPASRKSQRRTP